MNPIRRPAQNNTWDTKACDGSGTWWLVPHTGRCCVSGQADGMERVCVSVMWGACRDSAGFIPSPARLPTSEISQSINVGFCAGFDCFLEEERERDAFWGAASVLRTD